MKSSSGSGGNRVDGGVDGADIGPYPNEQFIISSQEGEATGRFNTGNVGGQGLSGSDILTLDMRGKETTKIFRSTLTSTKGSVLAEMFSGRWDASLSRNEQGHFYINYTPALFMPLLTFLVDLESQSMTGMNDNRLPPVTPSFTNPAEEASFRRMVDKFGLTNVLFNYEIYIMGTDHGTWNDMIHASMDCSILDYEMTATAEEAVRFFTLDRLRTHLDLPMVERSNRFKSLLVKGLVEGLAGFARRPSLPIQWKLGRSKQTHFFCTRLAPLVLQTSGIVAPKLLNFSVCHGETVLSCAASRIFRQATSIFISMASAWPLRRKH